MILEKLAGTILRYSMLDAGARLGVAVSGGADSVALLHLLIDYGRRYGLQLTVLHLDHCLRGEESRADSDFVRSLAASLGLPFHGEARDVRALDANLEQAARIARRQFYAQARRDLALDRVATGHTLRDQAETVLFRLLRGSGPSGLAGIHPVTADGLIRPLIEIDRPEIEQYLTGRGIGWREDSSNRSPRFARNRLRHEVMPLLESVVNPQARHALARLAAIAQDEEEYWHGLLSDEVPAPPGPTVLPVSYLAAAGPALARRRLRAALEQVAKPLRNITLEHVERVLELCRQPAGGGRVSLPVIDVWRSFDQLRLARAGAAPAVPRPLEISGPGRVTAGGVEVEITTREGPVQPKAMEVQSRYTGRCHWLDGEAVRFPLVLRAWQPGDVMQPVGHSHRVRLKELFQAARILAWERAAWPVLECRGVLVWARRFGPDSEAVARVDCRRWVGVEEC